MSNSAIDVSELYDIVQASDDLFVINDDSGSPIMAVLEYETVEVLREYIDRLEAAVQARSMELQVVEKAH